MKIAMGKDVVQKNHNKQLFSLFGIGLRASSENLKLAPFRMEDRHMLLILRTANF